MNNEPVAMRYDFDGYGYLYIDSGSGSDWQTRIKDAEPLYTAPQELSDELPSPVLQEYFEKGYKCAMESLQLSDEEIMDCIEEKTGHPFNSCDEDLLDFARAILKKASEK